MRNEWWNWKWLMVKMIAKMILERFWNDGETKITRNVSIIVYICDGIDMDKSN